MFSGNSSNSDANSLANYFSKYREENNYLITKFKNIQTYLKRLDKYEDYEKSEIVGNPIFGNSQLGEVFDSLDVNLSRALEVIEKLLESLQKEKEDITKHLGKLKHGIIESILREETMLIEYNKNQYDYMQDLNTMIPNVIELFENVIGTEDNTFEDKASGFIRFYQELEHVITNEGVKSHIFAALEKCLLDLEQYIGGNEKYFADHIREANPKQFVDNLFRISGGKTVVKDLKKIMKKIGRDKDKDITYSSLGDNEESVDKFMRATLELVFKGIKVNNKDLIKEYLDKIVKKKSNFKDLEKEFKENYTAVSNMVQKLDYVFTSNPNKKIQNLDEVVYFFTDINSDNADEKDMTFKTFKKKYLKDKKENLDILKESIRMLGIYATNEKSLKKFLDKQTVIQKAGKTTSGGIDSVDDFGDDEKKEIKKNFIKNAKYLGAFIKISEEIKYDSEYKQHLSKLESVVVFFNNVTTDDDEKIAFFIKVINVIFKKTVAESSIKGFYTLIDSLGQFISDNQNYSSENVKLIINSIIPILSQLKNFKVIDKDLDDFINDDC